MTVGQIDRLVSALDGAYDEGRPEARMARRALREAQEAGLFTLTIPPEPCSMPEILKIFQRVAAVEPGVAWSAMNSIVFGHATARLEEEIRSALLGRIGNGPFAFSGVPAGRAVPSDAGLVLNGFWPYVTGVEDCEIAVLAGLVQTGDRPDVRFFLVDSTNIEPGTNWQNVTGLRTSGSHSGRVSDLLIPDALAVRFNQPPAVDDPLYRLPVTTRSCRLLRCRPERVRCRPSVGCGPGRGVGAPLAGNRDGVSRISSAGLSRTFLGSFGAG